MVSKQSEVRCNHKNGKLHGLYQNYYSDGQLFIKRYYVNGIVKI
jgi:antitoxin component YwqK of YwqJK toxin-antitoxin module